MKSTGLSLDDVAVLAGVLMLGASAWWMAGAPGLLGFAGALFVIAGLAAAARRK